MARKCPFCGGTRLNKEHVIPKWLGALLPHRNVKSTHIPDSFVPQGRGTHKTAASMEVPVCESCNNGWMNRLEQDARPFIGPMALGRGLVLSRDAQAIVASWILKTSLTAMLTTKEWQRTPAVYEAFYDAKMPSANHHISTAAYSGENWSSVFHHQPLALVEGEDSSSRANPIHCHLLTLVVGNLVAQTFYFPVPVTITAQGKVRFIWPTSDDGFVWPTGILTAAEIEALAKTSLPSLDSHPLASANWVDLDPNQKSQ